ncbi:MAG: MerR family transcriptional regulator, partial [Acidaminococcaceae bacterium]
MRTIFSIGETAKIHHISKQSLIFYDKIGLLKPATINQDNGYRYYSLEEFAVLDIILFLKTLNVPLEAIKTYLTERTLDKSLAFFEQRLAETEARMKSLKAVKQKIENTLAVYEEYKECN